MANKKWLIDAEKLQNRILNFAKRLDEWNLPEHAKTARTIAKSIRCEKPVDAVEVVHGRWIPTYHTYYNRDGACRIADEFHCSKCEIYSRSKWNYCPNCGAKMDGDGNG